jgi:uncharacterized protein
MADGTGSRSAPAQDPVTGGMDGSTVNAAVLMGLGAFRFSLPTAAYEALARQTAWRWESVDRIGRVPARQFLGPGDDTITLSGAVFPAFAGAGLGQVEALRTLAGQGAPLMLVDGLGKVHGRWVVLDVSEDQSAFLPGGAPRKQAFSIKLGAYGEDA